MADEISRLAVVHADALGTVTDDQGNAVIVVSDDPQFRHWLCRPVVDDYGNEVTPNAG